MFLDFFFHLKTIVNQDILNEKKNKKIDLRSRITKTVIKFGTKGGK
jgi:hypothetical protein